MPLSAFLFVKLANPLLSDIFKLRNVQVSCCPTLAGSKKVMGNKQSQIFPLQLADGFPLLLSSSASCEKVRHLYKVVITTTGHREDELQWCAVLHDHWISIVRSGNSTTPDSSSNSPLTR